jgi:hypothetical protein
MKTHVKIFLAVFFAVLPLFAVQSQAQNNSKGRYIVTVNIPGRGAVGNYVRAAGGEVIHEYNIIPAIAIEIPNTAMKGLLQG